MSPDSAVDTARSPGRDHPECLVLRALGVLEIERPGYPTVRHDHNALASFGDPRRATINVTRILTVALATGILAAGASAVTAPTPASAHTPEVSATCSTLTVALTNYSNDKNPNSISVSIDSETVEETRFGSAFDATYPLGDTTAAHDYLVRIDAPGKAYDREFAGSSVPCEAEVAPDASAALAVTPATCDTTGTLVLGESKNATWGEPTATTGPAKFSVTATADEDHAFSDGARTKTFTGAIEGRLDPAEAPCASVVVVPERPVPTVVVTDETARDCDSLTQTTTTTTTTTGWRLDETANVWVPTPAVVTTTNATVPVAAAECPTVETPPTGTTTPPTPSTPADVTARDVPVEALATTGSNAGAVAPIGAALLLAGMLLVVGRRVHGIHTARRD